MIRYSVATVLCLGVLSFSALQGASSPEPASLKPLAPAVRLWDGRAPLAHGEAETDVPTITPYLLGPLPDGKGRPCMIICPGGAYVSLTTHEGDFYAHWLNELGTSAFVLKYRLGPYGYRHPTMLNDAARAVRLVRAHAQEYGIDPQRVGIIGSSAGGHLASTLLTHFSGPNPQAQDPVDRPSDRPDVGVLLYPVITMDSHSLSRENLLGKNPSKELLDLLSNEKQVRDDTPSTFLVHSVLDKVVPARNSLLFAEALNAHGVPFELHLYSFESHGFGLGTRRKWLPEQRHPWVKQCERWLAQQGFVSAP